MPDKIPIYTIQFLDLPFNERNQHLDAERNLFLDFITKHVFETALKNQILFKSANCDAEYFHEDKNYTNKIPKIINCFIKDDVLSIRAYTKKGIDTLKFWYKLYKKEHPENCNNIRTSNESYDFKSYDQRLNHYSSKNWIPSDSIVFKNNQYFEKIKTKKKEEKGFIDKKEIKTLEPFAFESKLIGHIRTLISGMGIDNAEYTLNVDLKQIPTNHRYITAFKHIDKTGKLKEMKMKAFRIAFSTNYELPFIFSLGKKVGYGNGVFEKEYPKNNYNEKSKTNLKPYPMEK